MVVVFCGVQDAWSRATGQSLRQNCCNRRCPLVVEFHARQCGRHFVRLGNSGDKGGAVFKIVRVEYFDVSYVSDL
jgi:hypothetical protein